MLKNSTVNNNKKEKYVTKNESESKVQALRDQASYRPESNRPESKSPVVHTPSVQSPSVQVSRVYVQASRAQSPSCPESKRPGVPTMHPDHASSFSSMPLEKNKDYDTFLIWWRNQKGLSAPLNCTQ